MEFELVIVGGEIIDGTGAPPYRGDVGISRGKIIEIGDLHSRQAQNQLNAEGRMVAPGFIDIHSHDDFNLMLNPLANGKTLQGVTTVVTGNCGFSPAPIVSDKLAELRSAVSFLDSGLDYSWQSFAEFLASIPPVAINIVPLVGHVTIRCGAMGLDDRSPKKSELERMQALLVESMEAGAFGFSTGLIYPPSSYATEEEILKLAGISARFGGGYFTHMRDEGTDILNSIQETIQVGRRSGAYIHISHLKVNNPANWGRAGEVLAAIDFVRDDGIALTCDQYPYTATSTGLKAILPKWVHGLGNARLDELLDDEEIRKKVRIEILDLMKDGSSSILNWKDVIISDSPSNTGYSGLNLVEIAEKEGKEPVDAVLDMLIADKCETIGIYFTISEEDMFEIMRHPAVAIGSDGMYKGIPGKHDPSKPHPRYFGTFPRVIGRYAREGRLPSLAEAVRKMTSLPAEILGLRDRGRIKPGLAADLVVFDPVTVIDTATYQTPHRMPIGIETVLVNGTPVVQNNRANDSAPGIVLRRETKSISP